MKWLRSPWKEPIGNSWIVTGSFLTNSGEDRELNFPWSNLPILRLGWGAEFLEAPTKKISWGPNRPFPNSNYFLGERIDLEIDSIMKFCCADDIPELKNYIPPNSANFHEECVVVKSSHGLLVITIIEYIRAFLIGHGQLAEGILEPNYLERIIDGYKLTSKCLRIEFSKDILAKHVSHPLIVCISQILYHLPFRRAWNQIYYNRRLSARYKDWNSAIPLVTQLPNPFRFWKVSIIPIGKINLVLEIVSVSSYKISKFNTIEYTHPQFNRAFYEFQQEQRGIKISSEGPLVLDRHLRVSTDSQVKNVIFDIFCENKIKMKKVIF